MYYIKNKLGTYKPLYAGYKCLQMFVRRGILVFIHSNKLKLPYFLCCLSTLQIHTLLRKNTMFTYLLVEKHNFCFRLCIIYNFYPTILRAKNSNLFNRNVKIICDSKYSFICIYVKI